MQSLANDGMTMVVVTHELKFAREVSDTVVFMYDDNIVEEGWPELLVGSPKHERLQAFSHTQ